MEVPPPGSIGDVKVKIEPVVSEPIITPPEKQGVVAGGIDNSLDEKRQLLIAANEELRQAIKLLSDRQAILEEYVEVELDGATGITRYKTNKKRAKFAVGMYKSEAETTEDGKRTEKYEKAMRVMKMANAYWKREVGRIHRPSNTDARLRYEMGVPQEMAEMRLHVDFDSGVIGRKPVKRCHKCFDESHEMKFCPHKHVESRSPEVTAMIQARYEQLKQTEGRDPLLSKGYKRRFCQVDLALKDERRKKHEANRQRKMAKLMLETESNPDS